MVAPTRLNFTFLRALPVLLQLRLDVFTARYELKFEMEFVIVLESLR